MAKKTPMDAVNEIREKQEALRVKITETETARVSEQDALANVEAMLKRVVEDARRVMMLHQVTQAGYTPTNRLGLDQLTPFAIAVLTNEKGVRDFLKAEVREDYLKEGVTAIASKDRAALLDKHRKDLYALEREEERAICEVEAAGIDIDRRCDARPEIVLGLAEGEKPAWDFTSDRLDRITGSADAAKSLYDVRQDAWLEAREVLMREEQRLADLKQRNEPEPGLRAQRQSVEIARKALDRAKALREEAHENLRAKLAVADSLKRWLEENRKARPSPYSQEDFQVYSQKRQVEVSTPKDMLGGGYDFGAARSKGMIPG